MVGNDRSGFFHNAQNFNIYGGTFIDRGRDVPNLGIDIDDRLGLPIIRPETISLVKQVVCCRSYRIHAAELNGRAVAVKVFSGPRAQEDRDEVAAANATLWHPNFLQILGCSPEYSPDPFLIS
ncbi:hypothetical protein B0H19DRAFT_1180828 [Mycena capillaripes]|nr:hypothetical protein B0H19DRAFT_1180828 [Mycena capillaripes]